MPLPRAKMNGKCPTPRAQVTGKSPTLSRGGPSGIHLILSLDIYYFSTVVDFSYYWTRQLLVPAEKFTLRMPMMGPKLSTTLLLTECFSHRAEQLKRYWCIIKIFRGGKGWWMGRGGSSERCLKWGGGGWGPLRDFSKNILK